MKRTRRSQEEIDAELYSTSVLEELMESNEWRRVDQVVQLAFRAVADALATHAHSLTDLKALLTTRASKTELNTGLSLKTNLTDVSKTVEQLSRALEERPSYQEVSSMLRDYASRADLVEVLASQAEKQESGVVAEREALEVSILKARMDDFQKEISKRVGACVTLPEFQQVLTLLDGKVMQLLMQANISQINEALQGKVSKQFLSTALQKKVSKNDLEAALAKKADTADLDYLIASIEGKVSVATLQRLHQVLQNKADKSQLLAIASDRTNFARSQKNYEEILAQQVEQIRASINLQLKQARQELALQAGELQTTLQALAREKEVEAKKAAGLESQLNKKIGKMRAELEEELQGIRQLGRAQQDELNVHKKAVAGLSNDISVRRRGEENIYSQIDDVRKKLQEAICRNLDKKEFIDFKSEVTEALAGRVEMEVMQTALDQITSDTNARLTNDKREIEEMVRTLLKRTQDRLEEGTTSTAVELIELKKAVARKQERGENAVAEDGIRKVRKQVEDCRKTVDLAYSEIHAKISVKEYEADLLQIRRRFESLTRDVAGKANIKDVCVLADSKPNIDDVNTALREINEALAQRVTEVDLQSVLKDQAAINETLCAQNIVGRWMWQSGELKAGGLIPWESQSANSVPDHYFWEKDKTSILIIAAGVYEVIACVFGKSGSVAILANGEIVNPKGEQNSPGNLNRRPRKRKEKDVGSSSVCQYLMLPQRSRISVSVGGEVAQGLLSIRRL